MEHIQCFEQFIIDATDHTFDLATFLSQEVAVFTQYIHNRAWKEHIRILDADGKSGLLAVGLSLQGYNVYTINQTKITMPDPLELSMRQPIKTFQWNEQDKFKVAILPHDAISENLTEDALQQTLTRVYDVLEKNGVIMIETRFYDHLLHSQLKSDAPYQIAIANKRFIKLSVWNWLCKADCTYQQDQFVIQQIDDSCTIQNNRSHHRAWRRAELNMSLSQAGFKGIQYHSFKKEQTLITATKV